MKDANNPIIQRRPQKKQRKFGQLNLLVFALVVMGLLVGGVYYFMAAPQEQFALAFFTQAPVIEREFAITVTATGTVVPRTQSSLRAPAAGSVVQVEVKEGNDVEAGDLLVVIDSPAHRAELIAAERNLRQAEQDLESLLFDQALELDRLDRELAALEETLSEAQEDLALKELSFAYGAVAKRDLDRAVQSVADAEASLERSRLLYEDTLRKQAFSLQRTQERVDEARAALEEAQALEEALHVRAPFAGRVVELNVAEGQEVANNAVLLHLVDVVNPYIRANIDAGMVELIELGHEAAIKTSLRAYEGTVSHIAAQAVEVGGSPVVETHLVFSGEVSDLRPSSAVTVEMEVGRRQSPSLPRGPYLTSGQQLFVYVLEGDQAVRREVRYGMVTSAAVEILSGLEPGELVITSSYDEFRHLPVVPVASQGGLSR